MRSRVVYPPKDTNSISLCGFVEDDLEFDHEYNNTKMYTASIGVLRLSGFEDTIPVYISDQIRGFNSIKRGTYIGVSGSIRSALFRDDNGSKRTRVFVVVTSINEVHDDLPHDSWYKNEAVFEGRLFKSPYLRKSKSDKSLDLCELIVETHKGYNKYSHIPSIVWGETALGVCDFEKSDKVRITGRLQSRYFIRHKSDSDIDFETGISYEVSVGSIDLLQ